jgi:hypothetical protein
MEKVYNNILSSEDIHYLTQHEETLSARTKLDSLCVDSLRVDSLRVDSLDLVNFSIELTDSIQKVIKEQFGITISNVPMRWIKGDTPEHTDHSCMDFENTYLIYLTDSIGEFVLNDTSYTITKNTAFKFNEGVSHKTINTGDIPRLLLGPMNEFGITVGVPPAPPATPTIKMNMRSLFSNNAQVFYKPHSLAPGGTGGVKNYRKKSKKT